MKAGVDVIACETQPCLDEVKAILKLLESEFSNIVAWVTFSCKDGTHTNKGDSIIDCAKVLS